MMQTATRRWLFWLLLVFGFLFFLHAIKAILLPFIVGLLVAYFLDPAADRLERAKLSRNNATVVVLLLFFGAFGLVMLLLIPALIEQIRDLAAALPALIAEYKQMLQVRLGDLMQRFSPATIAKAQQAVANGSGGAASTFGSIAESLLSSGAALLNLASLLVITPIVSFYLLRDWDKIIAKMDDLLPPAYASTIREQASLIDRTLSGYVRGMANVILVLGFFYVVALSLVGLDFAILIGLLGGIAIIIPYVGTLVSGAAAVGMAYLQFDSIEPVLVVLAIFSAGQVLEGYVLTPKLVGDRIGLHPVWLIFGMLAGAALFGFVGVLLAIPVTAILGVLTRFAITQYKNSDYYHTRP